MYKKYLGPKIYLIILLGISSGLMEGLGIFLFLPLLSSLQPNPGSINEGNIEDSLWIIEWISALPAQNILFLIVLLFFLKGIFLFSALAFDAYLRTELLTKLKILLFDSLIKTKYENFLRHDAGHFTNVMNEQVNRSLVSFNSLTQLTSQLVNVIVYSTIAVFLSWELGVAAIIFGVIVILIFRALNRAVTELSRNAANENGRLNQLLIQFVHAFGYILMTNTGDNYKKNLVLTVEQLAGFQRKIGVYSAFTQAAREPIAVILIGMIIVSYVFYFEQALSAIMLSILLFYRSFNAFIGMQSYWQGALENIGSIEIIDRQLDEFSKNRAINGNRNLARTSQQLELKNITFKYENTKPSIKNLSLSIPKNKTVAIVGSSGSGKTTLLNLILLSIQPTKGEILIGGIDYRLVNQHSYRKNIGYVCQEPIIFNDTIRNNIIFYNDDLINDPELDIRIAGAVENAGLFELVETLPNGLDTMVGDRGISLSGGQKQRINIARELIKKPKVLILDEATSSLDKTTEMTVQKNIEKLKGSMTIIIVAHRLSTIVNADTIYVLQDGKIIEAGSFNELIDMEQSAFKTLYANEFK